ncbi:AraC family transcriptional regulator [Vibrio sp. vnigr-6D03]|uniref:AraC family transcriptional regulator n=1 Tax=Vibrio sp. vnigr-6D03 TaxID=2058088 RepID=UPI000C342C35|nr:AraC family transcriptional regulator [Vibrio sp. vnigr-6D03]PKF77675.1 AraC family transcriptional regulator [Vibrio sp. vnigr-6D03]
MANVTLQKFSNFQQRDRDRYHAANPVIFMVIEGSASFKFPDGVIGKLSSGEFTLLDISLLTDVKTDLENNAINATAIHLDTSILQSIKAGTEDYVFGKQENSFVKFDSDDVVAQSIQDLLIGILEKAKGPNETAEFLARALVSEMLKVNPSLRRLIHNSFELKVSQRVIQHIEKNIRSEISLESVSRTLGMSPATLKRRLSAEELSFSHLLKEKRINYAANQLRASHESICEIAFQSGFKSAAHFSTAFKSIQGMTPKEFRSRINWNREELRHATM